MSRLWVDMVKELHPDYKPNMDWWKAAELQQMRYNREYVCFVAEQDNKIVGFVDFVLILEPSTNTIIAVGKQMYVRPESRKTRVGWELHKMYPKVARSRGAMEMMFETTNPAMWAKHGYKIVKYVVSKKLEAEA